MYRLLESIKIVNGTIPFLLYHQRRMDRSFRQAFGASCPYAIADIPIPVGFKKGTFKWRIEYDPHEITSEFVPYKIRNINTIKLAEASDLIYDLKYADRSQLDKLFDQRGGCDDIIITKEGWLTDSYYCNIALQKDDLWLTPNRPLLKGTKREYLIHNRVIIPAAVHKRDLDNYTQLCLFNAMIAFGELTLPTSSISS